MSSFLYYSISSNFTKNEKNEIDNQINKNREEVYLLVKELPLNLKRKAKRLGSYIVFMFAISQPLVSCAAAVIMPLPLPVHRLSPIEQDRILSNKNYSPQIAHILKEKVDKIIVRNDKIQKLNNLALQLNSGSITIEEAVLQLRGGDGLIDIVVIIAFVIFINWYYSLFGVEVFKAVPLPPQDPFGWLSGKYDSKPIQHRSYKSSKFELEMAGVSDNMCPAMADENGFVMSYEDAYNLVSDTYPGYLEVNKSCKITDW